MEDHATIIFMGEVVYLAEPAFRRHQLYEDADFGPLSELSGYEPIAYNLAPEIQMTLVAKRIHQTTEALRAAHMYTAFGVVYGALSHNIVNGVHNGEFSEPEALGRQAIHFLEYWQQPVFKIGRFLNKHDNDYGGNVRVLHDRRHGVSRSWQRTYLDPRMESAEPVVQFSSGMISHIIGDLAISLAESRPPLSYWDDYSRIVNSKIRETSYALAPKLVPGHPLLRKAIMPIVVGGIAGMRNFAWNEFRELSSGSMDEVQVDERVRRHDVYAERGVKGLLSVEKPLTKAAKFTERILVLNEEDFHKAA